MQCLPVLVDGLSLISESATSAAPAAPEDVANRADAGIGVPDHSRPVGYLPGTRRTNDEWKWAVEGVQSVGDTLAANGVISRLNR